jgi:hypothetical protein
MPRKSVPAVVVASLFAVAALGCKKRTFNANVSTAGVPEKPSFVAVQCLAPQGNGGNWSSTLGWVSELWMTRAEQVEVAEGKEPNTGWLYLACAAGGSSGSGVTATVMSLLQNQKLFAADPQGNDRRSKGLFTVAETKMMAAALRYVAIGSDLRFSESVAFAMMVADQSLRGGTSGFLGFMARVREFLDPRETCSNKYKQGRDPIGVEWWGGQPADPCDAVVNFAKYAWMAKHVTPEMIKAPDASSQWSPPATVGSAGLESGPVELPKLFQLSNANDPNLLKAYALPEDADSKNAETYSYWKLRKEGHRQALFINRQLDTLIREATPESQKSLLDNDIPKPESVIAGVSTFVMQAKGESHPIAKDVLGQPPLTGYFTITTAVVDAPARFTDANKTKKPLYQEIRYVVLGSQETMNLIAQSPLFQKHLKSCGSKPAHGGLNGSCYLRRFVLAVVEQTHYMMQPSVREPGLMEELVAPAWTGGTGAQHMGIVAMADLSKASAGEPVKFTSMREGAAGASTVFGVTGGWPDRRITAWLQTYMIDALINGTSGASKTGPLSVAVENSQMTVFQSTFGKPDTDGKSSSASTTQGSVTMSSVTPETRSTDPEVDSFDTKAVRASFSGGSADSAASSENPAGQENVSDYVAFQNAFYSELAPDVLTEEIGTPYMHDEISVNWDLFKLPVMINLNIFSDPQRSRHLVHLAANAVREGLPRDEHFKLAGSQVCAVVSKRPTLGRTSCSRVMLPKTGLMLGKKDYRDVAKTVADKSYVVFNARDPRLTDDTLIAREGEKASRKGTPTKEDFE